MRVEMLCACEASFSLDSDQEDTAWFMVFRFANQHVACGYMTAASTEDESAPKKRIIKGRRDDAEQEP